MSGPAWPWLNELGALLCLTCGAYLIRPLLKPTWGRYVVEQCRCEREAA